VNVICVGVKGDLGSFGDFGFASIGGLNTKQSQCTSSTGTSFRWLSGHVM